MRTDTHIHTQAQTPSHSPLEPCWLYILESVIALNGPEMLSGNFTLFPQTIHSPAHLDDSPQSPLYSNFEMLLPPPSLSWWTCFLFPWKKRSNQKWTSASSIGSLHLCPNALPSLSQSLFLKNILQSLEKANAFNYLLDLTQWPVIPDLTLSPK